MILIIIIVRMNAASSDKDAERLVAARLSANGFRHTSARRLVAAVLAKSSGPLSANELAAALEGAIPLSSLYRTLSVLQEAGVLAKEHGSNGIARYELAEWLTGHHHHLICNKCGDVQDVEIDGETEAKVGSLIDHIATAAGYVASGHRIDIKGECSTCAAT
jgi:Fur family ferric uptake transcriptional regulator